MELADLDFHLADEDTMAHVVLRSQEALGQVGLDEHDVRAWARALLGVYDYVDTHAVYACVRKTWPMRRRFSTCPSSTAPKSSTRSWRTRARMGSRTGNTTR
ncbi:MAG: hypothetical protein R3F17_09145 [Planctomycetota bacterium]